MKTISVPIDAEAALRLDQGLERSGDVVELVIPDDQFTLLFSSGWVREVNSQLGCLIDDFEDEHISDPILLTKLVAISERFEAEHGGIFSKLPSLGREAIDRKTGLHFYF